MRAHLLLLLVGIVVLQGAALAQSAAEPDGELLSYELIPPMGWVLDQENDAVQGALAVLYPKGSTWDDATAVMRVDVTEKGEGENLHDRMQEDSLRLMKDAPGTAITPLPSMRTVDGRTAVLRQRVNAVTGNHEAIAYIEEQESVISLVLSARTDEAFTVALRDFEFLVGSFHIPGGSH